MESFLNCRIRLQDDYGTVKYVGAVEGYKGPWLGIDWDNADRGKHDGIVNGVRYFQAHSATSASFVRSEKVDFGKSLEAAVRDKYALKYDLDAVKSQLTRLQHEMNAPFVELVGMEKINRKQSDSNRLIEICVQSSGISSIGELSAICPNTMHLDISSNLLSNWSDIVLICRQLPHLERIVISGNRLGTFQPSDHQETFPNIKSLTCESMQYDWNDVVRLTVLFPHLQILNVGRNRITHIEIADDHRLHHLESLNLLKNCIEDWTSINELSKLPNLNSLKLFDVGLKNISIYADNTGFTKLEFLNIDENLIDNWRSIGELNKLPSLTKLICNKNPILQIEKPETRDQVCTARIANLKILNGHTILPEERRGAEYDYIKKYGVEWLQVKETENKSSFCLEHSRYEELIKKYGEMDASELIEKPQNIKVNLIALSIVYDDRTIIKKLPPSLTVQKFIVLIKRLFGLMERPNLVYTSDKMAGHEFPMDDEFKDLDYYAVQSGDKVIVKV